MKAVVHGIDLPARGRLLAVSDVHGNLPWLRGLLERARFSSEDALVLVGDLVEKGPESLATLRYVIDLSRTHTSTPYAATATIWRWISSTAAPA